MPLVLNPNFEQITKIFYIYFTYDWLSILYISQSTHESLSLVIQRHVSRTTAKIYQKQGRKEMEKGRKEFPRYLTFLELLSTSTRVPSPLGRGAYRSRACQEPGRTAGGELLGRRASRASSAAPHLSPSPALPPEPPLPHPWKNCLPRNRPLVPKRLGTAALVETKVCKVGLSLVNDSPEKQGITHLPLYPAFFH